MKLSKGVKQRYKRKQLIEETLHGEPNPEGPCSRCQAKGFACRTFTNSYQQSHGASAQCSRCRVDYSPCKGSALSKASQHATAIPLEPTDSDPLLPVIPLVHIVPAVPSIMAAVGPSSRSAPTTVMPQLLSRLERENVRLDEENTKLNNDLDRAEHENAALRRQNHDSTQALMDEHKRRNALEEKHSRLKRAKGMAKERLTSLLDETIPEHRRLTRGLLVSIGGWNSSYRAVSRLARATVAGSDSTPLVAEFKRLRRSTRLLRASTKEISKDTEELLH